MTRGAVTVCTVLHNGSSNISSSQMLHDRKQRSLTPCYGTLPLNLPHRNPVFGSRILRHMSFRKTGRTLNSMSSFSPPQCSVYFVYTLTELESRIWSWVALNQKSQTMVFGTKCRWQTPLFGEHNICKSECEHLCSGTRILSYPTDPISSCCLSSPIDALVFQIQPLHIFKFVTP